MFENIDRRKLIIYSLVALLIIIAALILWWLFGPKAQAPAAVAPPTQPQNVDQAVQQPAPLPPVSEQRIQEAGGYPLGLKQLAMAFAERFGSYSTDEPVKNMADLETLMTDNFKKSAALLTNQESAEVFSGFSTKALSSNLINSTADAATIIVKTQRTQTVGSGDAIKTFFADMELKAVKSGNDWKIDSAKWQ